MKALLTVGMGAFLFMLLSGGALNSPPPALTFNPAGSNGYAQGGGQNAQQSQQAGQQSSYYASGSVANEAVSGRSDGLFMDDSLLIDGDAQVANRVILKSAYLSLIVDAADENIAAISKLAEDMGGWVVSSNTNQVTTANDQTVTRGSIVIRVPAARLDEAMTQIKSGAGTVQSESITGEDVTQQYVDLKSRLTNLEAAEAQLREILASATRTQDVLDVYQQLVSTRGEIEVVRGQIQYYDESAAYSSITVDLTPKAINIPVQIAGWSPSATVERAAAGLISALQFVVDLLIVVVVQVLPLVVIIGVPLWLIWRRFRNRKPVVTVNS